MILMMTTITPDNKNYDNTIYILQQLGVVLCTDWSLSIINKKTDWQGIDYWIPHHVGMGLFRTGLRRVLVQELVDLWLSQAVPYLDILNEKHESGGLLCVFWILLVLETNLTTDGQKQKWSTNQGKGERQELNQSEKYQKTRFRESVQLGNASGPLFWSIIAVATLRNKRRYWVIFNCIDPLASSACSSKQKKLWLQAQL